jgi:putative transposase
MGKKKGFSGEEIIRKLRQAEVLLHEGRSVVEACRELGVTDSTYYKWRREYGGLKLDQARRLKDLERENGRLRRVVADLTLDKLILQETAAGKQ